MLTHWRYLQDRVDKRPITSKSTTTVNLSEFNRLEMIVERHSLVLEAILRMIVDKGMCTLDDLNALAKEIDAEDGVVDGRRNNATQLARGAVTCPTCERKTSAKNPVCQWCSVEMPYTYM